MALISPPDSVGTGVFHAPPRRRSRSALETPYLSAIIVNYRQWHGTAALTRRLIASPSGRQGQLEVMVVDNHSPAARLAARLRRWPGVSLRRWKGNRGFARAVNEGNRLSRGRWLLLLNPDVTVTESFVEGVMSLAARLETEEPRAGIVGFRLHNSDGSPQLSSGPFPTLTRTLLGLFRPRARRKYQAVPSERRCPVPWVTGCCLLVRRDCLEELGGLDPGFFLYYEDVDLCRRAWEHGWSVWLEPELNAVHHSPLHTRKVTPHLRLVTRHALLTYAAKHWAGWKARLLAGIVRAEAWLRRLKAKSRGDAESARTFQSLGALAGALAGGRSEEARRHLRRAVRREEKRRVA
jgi:N-acetylglucosaminyl-diphospho-decaprenol L-rhamnosyltransferase